MNDNGARGGRRLGVLISGRGSNLRAIIDAIAAGTLDATIAIVIANRAGATGLERARAAGIETMVLPASSYGAATTTIARSPRRSSRTVSISSASPASRVWSACRCSTRFRIAC